MQMGVLTACQTRPPTCSGHPCSVCVPLMYHTIELGHISDNFVVSNALQAIVQLALQLARARLPVEVPASA